MQANWARASPSLNSWAEPRSPGPCFGGQRPRCHRPGPQRPPACSHRRGYAALAGALESNRATIPPVPLLQVADPGQMEPELAGGHQGRCSTWDGRRKPSQRWDASRIRSSGWNRTGYEKTALIQRYQLRDPQKTTVISPAERFESLTQINQLMILESSLINQISRYSANWALS